MSENAINPSMDDIGPSDSPPWLPVVCHDCGIAFEPEDIGYPESDDEPLCEPCYKMRVDP